MTKKIITDYKDLQFTSLGEGSQVEVAVLWGNPEIGPAAVMVKFPEGYQRALASPYINVPCSAYQRGLSDKK